MERVRRVSMGRKSAWAGAAVTVTLGAALATQASQPGPGASGSPATANVARIATLDVYSLTERLMSLPEGLASLDAAANSFQVELTTAQKEFEELATRVNTLPKNDPAYEATLKEARDKQVRVQRLQSEIDGAIEGARARLLIGTFKQVTDASSVVAAREGYAYVLNSRSTSRTIETNSVTIALQELLARPMILAPVDSDITERVAAELKLPPPDAPATPAPASPGNAEPGSAGPK